MNSTHLTHFTNPRILEQLGRSLLTRFFDHFAADLKAAPRSLPNPTPSNDAYFECLASELASPEDYPPAMVEALLGIERAASPECRAQLEAAMAEVPNHIGFKPAHPPIHNALLLWLWDASQPLTPPARPEENAEGAPPPELPPTEPQNPKVQIPALNPQPPVLDSLSDEVQLSTRTGRPSSPHHPPPQLRTKFLSPGTPPSPRPPTPHRRPRNQTRPNCSPRLLLILGTKSPGSLLTSSNLSTKCSISISAIPKSSSSSVNTAKSLIRPTSPASKGLATRTGSGTSADVRTPAPNCRSSSTFPAKLKTAVSTRPSSRPQPSASVRSLPASIPTPFAKPSSRTPTPSPGFFRLSPNSLRAAWSVSASTSNSPNAKPMPNAKTFPSANAAPEGNLGPPLQASAPAVTRYAHRSSPVLSRAHQLSRFLTILHSLSLLVTSGHSLSLLVAIWRFRS